MIDRSLHPFTEKMFLDALAIAKNHLRPQFDGDPELLYDIVGEACVTLIDDDAVTDLVGLDALVLLCNKVGELMKENGYWQDERRRRR